ncbi:MAG: hypothetical protein ABI986_02035 [Chloroflexota bacterium]
MKIEFENKYARLSLISITLMMLVTSVHHIYRLGFGLLIPTIILTSLPYILMRWYGSSKNTTILKSYSLYSTLMFTWFGFIDGFMDHVFKAVGLPNTTFLPGSDAEVVKTALSLWSPAAGNIFYEWTGILTFVVGAFAMGYLIKMIQAKHADDQAGQLELVKS